jgi:hypothetical protein
MDRHSYAQKIKKKWKIVVFDSKIKNRKENQKATNPPIEKS